MERNRLCLSIPEVHQKRILDRLSCHFLDPLIGNNFQKYNGIQPNAVVIADNRARIVASCRKTDNTMPNSTLTEARAESNAAQIQVGWLARANALSFSMFSTVRPPRKKQICTLN